MKSGWIWLVQEVLAPGSGWNHPFPLFVYYWHVLIFFSLHQLLFPSPALQGLWCLKHREWPTEHREWMAWRSRDVSPTCHLSDQSTFPWTSTCGPSSAQYLCSLHRAWWARSSPHGGPAKCRHQVDLLQMWVFLLPKDNSRDCLCLLSSETSHCCWGQKLPSLTKVITCCCQRHPGCP